MTAYLRGSQDFQKVYQKGKRYEGVLMTAFVLPNQLSHNSLVSRLQEGAGQGCSKEPGQTIVERSLSLKEVFIIWFAGTIRLGN